MVYSDALNLESGDEVVIKGTEKVHKVECMKGTTKAMFILLDNGEEYRHDLLEKKTD